MRRFWLFGGLDYYPTGGMGDFKGSFDLLSEAVEYVKSRPYEDQFEWWHVFDRSHQIICEISSEYGPHGFDEFNKELKITAKVKQVIEGV